ncbi:uncharacterized protein TNCT_510981 [Trichonephila clavata]|uniref:LolA-like domain-containing protein n=1 Tax=Trichonephila clavata TaxID=2740835 RepID=A0A8X6LB49_TRICU|nr:uncharacterized protein TNCT_510981 [Trichonephila clavata]
MILILWGSGVLNLQQFRDVERPTFPDVFQVEVQGVFIDQQEEIDATMFYDRVNNRAALYLTYQGESTKSIYNFNDNQLLYIDGSDCTTSDISADSAGTFFPFTVVNDKKILAKPEEVFYFSKSKLDRQELFVFPSYIYTAKLDFPMYSRTNCDVTHIFTKPEVKVPDCDTPTCKSTLMAITVTCNDDKGNKEVEHTYNFFRFRSSISDPNVFIPPAGVFCKMTSTKPFPGLPIYFSFSYDLLDEQEEVGTNPGVYAVHKKVWYDSRLSLIRMDEYDDEGILIASRIFDFFGGVAYTTIASLSTCEKGPIGGKVNLDEMTRLPKILFVEKPTLNDAIYMGTRNIHALDYEVWSILTEEKETDAKIVQDFYFTKNVPKSQGPEKLKISHVEIYTYQRNEETSKFELSLFTYVAINNFIAGLRWEAFDISPCFTSEQKKGFRLKVDGPPTVKDSKTYLDILKRIYLNLIIASQVSVIRLSELTCVFDGVRIVEVTGWILEKSNVTGSETGKTEPDMNTAYSIIEKAARTGNLTVKIKKDGKDVVYAITAIETIEHPENKAKYLFSGGTLAAVSLVLFVLGILLGVISYYMFLKRQKTPFDYQVHMNIMKG